MNTTEHTPGPWTAVFEDYRWVISCRENFSPEKALAVTAGSYPAHEPNARLIAAAPDLLVAIQALLSMPDYDGTQPTSVTRRSAKHLARAAIAKATGEPA